MTTERPLCRHCSRRLACRRRGLCFDCDRDPAVRALYPLPAGKFQNKGGDFFGGLGLAQPTSELPATKAKIEVMRRRVEARLAVFHPADGRRGLG